MQMRLRKIVRESSEEMIVECDCRDFGNFLALVGTGWFIYEAWIFRDVLFRSAGSATALSRPTLAIWTLSAIVIAASGLWIAFGRRLATFSAGELRVRSTLGPLQVRAARIYPLTEIGDIRLWFQGVNDRGWKTTNRSIVFEHRKRIVILF